MSSSSSNGYGNNNNNGGVYVVLYKIVNSVDDADKDDALFNAFEMSRGSGRRGPTLATVKRNCAALHGLNHLGPDGYHWRVCVEDKPAPGENESEHHHHHHHGSSKTFSWWDIQDENAVLPLKTATQSQLSKFFAPPRKSAGAGELDAASASVDAAAKAAKGAFKSFGKAVTNAVVGDDASSSSSGPPITVIAFKLLDLVKMHDDFTRNGRGGGTIPQQQQTQQQQQVHRRPAAANRRSSSAEARANPPQQQQSYHSTSRARTEPGPIAAAATSANRAQQQQQQQQRARPTTTSSRAAPQEASLMDFGESSAPPGGRPLHHATSAPSIFGDEPPANETRAEKLKREYAKKHQNSNRVWDDVDQRWVEVCPKKANSAAGAGIVGKSASKSAPPGGDAMPDPNKKKEVGISLDPANAVGKSAKVQAAVNSRVNEMKQSQAKALEEVRAREAKKKSDEAEEDAVRKRLTPKIKAWSEEHGQKKQLRALLASLHTILWPGAKWKQVGIGDLLDDSKLKRCFHKASRVVHPDKTHHLDAEQRFLAKRIFDALVQAKQQYDDGAK